jgi:lysine/ornithine N-monooxygenase
LAAQTGASRVINQNDNESGSSASQSAYLSPPVVNGSNSAPNPPDQDVYSPRLRDPRDVATALESVSKERGRIFDLICVGFGPASLAIAIALADMWSKSSKPLPKVHFIEKQSSFAWHSGMQTPAAKMQISFLKDLATPRDPTSPFTFLNYLHAKKRLSQFTNLGTFMPSRMEFEDYMQWCAEFFQGVTKYDAVVQAVEPDVLDGTGKKVPAFKVKFKLRNGFIESASTRHVVIATGGEPYIPVALRPFTSGSRPQATHSGHYTTWIELHNNRVRSKMSKISAAAANKR